MDFINLNFEVRNKNLNSDDKKDVKNKKDIPTGENIQSNLAKPNSETLKAYRGVVAFKGNSSPLENSINAIARSLFPKSPNNIDLITIWYVIAGGIIGGAIGAKVIKKIPIKYLQIALALFMIFTGIKMFF